MAIWGGFTFTVGKLRVSGMSRNAQLAAITVRVPRQRKIVRVPPGCTGNVDLRWRLGLDGAKHDAEWDAFQAALATALSESYAAADEFEREMYALELEQELELALPQEGVPPH